MIIGGAGRLGAFLTKNLGGLKIISLDIKRSLSNSKNNKNIILRDGVMNQHEIISVARKIPKVDFIISATNVPSKQKDASFSEIYSLLLFPVDLILNLIDLKRIKTNGKIIFFGSANSKFISQRGIWYHICKSSLSIVVRYLALRLKNINATVNIISPGIVSYKKNGKILNAEKMNILSKKPVDPKQLLKIVRLLWECDSINCEEIHINGGYNIIDPYHFINKSK